MGVCGDASTYAKVATLLELIALPLYISGFATPSWMETETIRELIDLSVGLWKAEDCSSGSCQSKNVDESFQSNSFRAVQALQGIALAGYAVATFLVVIYFATDKARTKCYVISIVVFGFSASFICIISMIIWLVQIPEDYHASWSMGLTLLATGLYITAGCILLTDIRKFKKANIIQVKPRKHIPAPATEDQTFFFETPSPSPRYTDTKALPPSSTRYPDRKTFPSPPPSYVTRSPSAVRVDVESPFYADSVRSTRRYGTPQFSRRYDIGAR